MKVILIIYIKNVDIILIYLCPFIQCEADLLIIGNYDFSFILEKYWELKKEYLQG